MNKLTLDDIIDQREYEREREQFRSEVIALKKLRRIAIGPIVTVVCENATTVRFQIQEMARAEKMTTDEQIEVELATYNPLIPDVGEISMTLFLELTNDGQLREWLPRLVGVERSVVINVGEGDRAITVRAEVDPAHAAQLTRDEVTASVHYVRLVLDDAAQAAFIAGPATLGLEHEAYTFSTDLSEETRASIARDWGSGGGRMIREVEGWGREGASTARVVHVVFTFALGT